MGVVRSDVTGVERGARRTVHRTTTVVILSWFLVVERLSREKRNAFSVSVICSYINTLPVVAEVN